MAQNLYLDENMSEGSLSPIKTNENSAFSPTSDDGSSDDEYVTEKYIYIRLMAV
jgi:hypothetical protein